MNETIKGAESRLYVVSAAGMLGILVMAGLELSSGDKLIAAICIGLFVAVIINLIVYRYRRDLILANAITGAVGGIVAILGTVWGGYKETGWVTALVFVPLAFGSFQFSWGIVANLLLLLTTGGIIAWGFVHNWELGYPVIEYVIIGFAYIILTIISGATRWELESLLSHEKKIHNKLRKQERELLRFEAAAKQSVEMMVFTDPEGIVIWANEAAEKITGFTREETLNRKAGVLWGKLMPKEWYVNLWQTIKVEKKTFRTEIENHRKNGEHFFSTITIYPLLNKQGEVEFFVGTQRDITHEKAVDQMKTDFISLASHQLRTPLSSMRWNLEMLLSGDLGKLPAKQKKVINNIYASDKNMITLVSLLLNVSRIEAGKIEAKLDKYPIKSLLKDSLTDSMTKLKRRKQDLKYELENESTELTTDKELFGQVLVNLVNNAVKYSPEGSTITVKGESIDNAYRVTVIDQGVGIPEKDKIRVFGKYYRGSNVVKIDASGTGLGLYLCKIIINNLGGEIGYESIEGKGSRFWFTVPTKGVKPKGKE